MNRKTERTTVVLREFARMSDAQKWAGKIQRQMDKRSEKAQASCNQIDEGCVQVQITGDFGKEIYVADLV